MARSRNSTPLPLIKTHCGLRLPPERHCLLSANYKLRAAEVIPKKLGKSALERSKNKSTGSTILKRQSISNSGKSQTVSIPKPTFKVSANTNGNANGGGASSSSQPPLSLSNNHQMNIKMEVEDDYSNDSRGMKRKRDDDDDFEYEEEFEAVG